MSLCHSAQFRKSSGGGATHYALPRLLQGYRPIVASVILGFFWTLWHVPAFDVPGVAIRSAFAVTPLTIVLYLANNTALCLIFTGLFLRTKGSVLLAILLHAGSNASSNIIYEFFPEASLSVGAMELVYAVNVVLMGILGFAMLRGASAAGISPPVSRRRPAIRP